MLPDRRARVLNETATRQVVLDRAGALKLAATAADAWTVRERRQPEAETFYERPLPNTYSPNF
jgi:hypothetical protein